jgi:ParB/RepB/Spo0J family partition protein
MQTKLAHVSLAEITVSDTNKMFRDEAELTEVALKELVDSVRTNGVISPVMLRPSPAGPTKYQLVCGERRFRACGYALHKSIPANIRELTDDQALDLQLIENIERKDVHASKEAKAYKMYMDKHPEVTIADMALKFAKTEHYISIRLKLNDLVPEAMEDFSKNLMSIGHAMLIARLTPADQQNVVKEMTRSQVVNKRTVKYYETIQDLEDYINDSIICDLSSAAFKKDDATLLPKAGPCTTCPKRSGANQLFADMTEKDRCFDASCFLAKRIKFLATQLPEILEKTPDIALLAGYSSNSNGKKIDPQIEKVLKENKVKVLQPQKDYNTYSYSNNAKIKGIYINGDDVGKRVTVYSTTKKAEKSGPVAQEKVSNKEAIARIKERTERAAELDQEKVYAKILEALKAHPTQKAPDLKYYTDAEDAFINFILYDKLNYTEKEDFEKKVLGLSDGKYFDDPSFLFNTFLGLCKKGRRDITLYLARKVMLSSYSANIPDSDQAYFIKQIALGYKDIPIGQFEADQKAEREKREARAAERIRELSPKSDNKAKPTNGKGQSGKSTVLKGLSTLLNDKKPGLEAVTSFSASIPGAEKFVNNRKSQTKKAKA